MKKESRTVGAISDMNSFPIFVIPMGYLVTLRGSGMMLFGRRSAPVWRLDEGNPGKEAGPAKPLVGREQRR